MDTWVVSTFWILWLMLLRVLVHIYLSSCFNSFEYIPKSGNCWVPRWPCVELCEELPECFPQQLHQFSFPPAMHKGFNSSHPSQYLLFYVFLPFCTFVSSSVILSFLKHILSREFLWITDLAILRNRRPPFISFTNFHDRTIQTWYNKTINPKEIASVLQHQGKLLFLIDC